MSTATATLSRNLPLLADAADADANSSCYCRRIDGYRQTVKSAQLLDETQPSSCVLNAPRMTFYETRMVAGRLDKEIVITPS